MGFFKGVSAMIFLALPTLFSCANMSSKIKSDNDCQFFQFCPDKEYDIRAIKSLYRYVSDIHDPHSFSPNCQRLSCSQLKMIDAVVIDTLIKIKTVLPTKDIPVSLDNFNKAYFLYDCNGDSYVFINFNDMHKIERMGRTIGNRPHQFEVVVDIAKKKIFFFE